MTCRPIALLLMLCCVALNIAAQDLDARVQQLDERYPAGSIDSSVRAEHALIDARSLHDDAHTQGQARKLACGDQFFYNRCLEQSSAWLRGVDRIVDRIELEAHDRQRAINAQAHRLARQEELQRQSDDAALRRQRESEARDADLMRERDAQRRSEHKAQEDAAAQEARQTLDTRVAEHASREEHEAALRPTREQEATAQFLKKQQDAANYAASKRQESESNRQKRQEREAKRDAQNQRDASELARKPAPTPTQDADVTR
jgi:hypothetical protein